MRSIFFLFFLLFTFYFLLPTPLFAEECSYPQYCDSGTGPGSGQQSCTGTLNSNNQTCQWDPAVDPNCTSCQAINPTTTPTATTSGSSKRETAIELLNTGLVPAEIIPTPAPEGVYGFLNNLLGIFNPTKFFAQSQTIHQAYLPTELEENKDTSSSSKNAQLNSEQSQVLGITDDLLQKLGGFLGGSTGFYGATLPKEVAGEDIPSAEKAYEQANFPQEIKPITGQ